MPQLPRIELPGPPGDAGMVHARWLDDLLGTEFIRSYLDRLQPAVGFDPDTIVPRALSWLAGLPEHVREEVDGMARGSGRTLGELAAFLFADIAGGGGPMCSSVVAPLASRSTWIARNCDWLTPTLVRGTAAVCHATPHRIPIMAVGIRGDIDVDTGINAEGLWLHLHTLHATDAVPEGQRPMSWLFWAREALETSATLDDLERFVDRTPRDRGVFAIACDGKSGESAVFECGRASYVRHDGDGETARCVTNHTLLKTYPVRSTGQANESGTIARLHALERRLNESPPSSAPVDFCAVLGSSGVEMRTPKWIRTIYSAVAEPASGRIWFADGLPDGTPAASRGAWRRADPPW